MTSVLLLGVTGYIGGSFFTELKRVYPSVSVIALVRSSSHFDAIAAAGAIPIQGDFSEYEKIAKLAEKSDIVINAADSDSVDLANAILMGLKSRKESGKGVGAFIQVSGTAGFIVGEDGSKNESARVWDDLSEDDIKSITPSMLHGQVDVPILQASASGDVNAYILCPSAVYGPGTGPVGRASLFFKLYVGSVLQQKVPYVIGEGTNRFEFVHIDDLAALFLLIFSHALSSLTSTPNPLLSAYQRYFIGSVRSYDLNTISQLVSWALSRSDSERVVGKFESFDVKSYDADTLGWFGSFMGGNTYTNSGRGRQLGWNPNGVSLEETVEGDVTEALKVL